jgi:hypothetical protein
MDVDCRRVAVHARVRPPLPGEPPAAAFRRLQPQPARATVTLAGAGAAGATTARSFAFDAVFGPTHAQSDLYRSVGAPAVAEVLAGVHAVVLSAGQTNAGKTHSLFGPDVDGVRLSATDAAALGLVPRAMHDLFERIDARSSSGGGGGSGAVFAVSATYLQLYQHQWVDLLAPPPPPLHAARPPAASSSSSGRAPPSDRDRWLQAGGAQAGSTNGGGGGGGSGGGGHPLHAPPPLSPGDASRHRVGSVRDVLRLLYRGQSRRAATATRLNSHSSRGHTAFVVTVTRTLAAATAAATATATSQLTFIDLAGSERLARTGAGGVQLAEARCINASLSALSHVLSGLGAATILAGRRAAAAAGAWDEGGVAPPPSSFIPWRASKLTAFLHACLSGHLRPPHADGGAAPSAALRGALFPHRSHPPAPPPPPPSSLTLLLCLSPADVDAGESLSTLIFGARARATAEALAGDAATAAQLLRDATYRQPRSSSSAASVSAPHGRGRSDDGARDPPSESAPEEEDDEEAGGRHADGSAGGRDSEVDRVLDRQRQLIGALSAENERLAAQHASALAELARARQRPAEPPPAPAAAGRAAATTTVLPSSAPSQRPAPTRSAPSHRHPTAPDDDASCDSDSDGSVNDAGSFITAHVACNDDSRAVAPPVVVNVARSHGGSSSRAASSVQQPPHTPRRRPPPPPPPPVSVRDGEARPHEAAAAAQAVPRPAAPRTATASVSVETRASRPQLRSVTSVGTQVSPPLAVNKARAVGTQQASPPLQPTQVSPPPLPRGSGDEDSAAAWFGSAQAEWECEGADNDSQRRSVSSSCGGGSSRAATVTATTDRVEQRAYLRRWRASSRVPPDAAAMTPLEQLACDDCEETRSPEAWDAAPTALRAQSRAPAVGVPRQAVASGTTAHLHRASGRHAGWEAAPLAAALAGAVWGGRHHRDGSSERTLMGGDASAASAGASAGDVTAASVDLSTARQALARARAVVSRLDAAAAPLRPPPGHDHEPQSRLPSHHHLRAAREREGERERLLGTSGLTFLAAQPQPQRGGAANSSSGHSGGSGSGSSGSGGSSAHGRLDDSRRRRAVSGGAASAHVQAGGGGLASTFASTQAALIQALAALQDAEVLAGGMYE